MTTTAESDWYERDTAQRDAAARAAAVEHARHRLIRLALECVARDYAGDTDQAVRADDRLFAAARDLVTAVGELPAAEQPEGWGVTS